MTLPQLLSAHPAACVALATLVGLIGGSFLNVVVFRLPRILEREWQWEAAERSGDVEASSHFAGQRFGLATPRSRCPACAAPIRPLDLLPVLGYLRLRGRCRACDWKIPLRYPAIEISSALAAGVVAWQFGCGAPMASALLLTFALIALAGIDLETGLLPDAITLPFLWLGLAINLFGVHTALPSAVMGAIAGYGILWLVFHAFRAVTGREGMGHGDFKLLAMLGAWLGWQALPLLVFLSSAAALVVGLGSVALGWRQRSSPIPFGPFLAAAGWLSLLFGDSWTGAYLQWIGATS